MADFLTKLSQYAQLINFVLFATIVGWLFQITQSYKESKDKESDAQLAVKERQIAELNATIEHNKREHDLLIASKEQKILILQERLELKEQQIKASEKQIEFVTSLLEENVQKRIKELEQKEKTADAEQKLEIQNQKNVLQNSLEKLKNIDYSLVGVLFQIALPFLLSSIKIDTSGLDKT